MGVNLDVEVIIVLGRRREDGEEMLRMLRSSRDESRVGAIVTGGSRCRVLK